MNGQNKKNLFISRFCEMKSHFFSHLLSHSMSNVPSHRFCRTFSIISNGFWVKYMHFCLVSFPSIGCLYADVMVRPYLVWRFEPQAKGGTHDLESITKSEFWSNILLLEKFLREPFSFRNILSYPKKQYYKIKKASRKKNFYRQTLCI